LSELKNNINSKYQTGDVYMVEEGVSKLKTLYILEVLNKETDEDNVMSVGSLIQRLKTFGIDTERRSVIKDIKLLIQYGYDISLFEENGKGYYMRTRKFEPHEIRLLIDAVQSSRFITKNKSRDLIKKVMELSSHSTYNSMKDCIYIDNRIKSKNEQIYYNIDKINRAIKQNKKIQFQYYTYNLDKKLELYRGGHKYKISPYHLSWYEDYYYLICNYDHYDDISHFRVDKMTNIEIMEENRLSLDKVSGYLKNTNIAEYINKIFNMYTGTSEHVELKCNNSLINSIMDKFGEEVIVTKSDEDNFIVRTDAIISEGFISWIVQFGSKIEVLSPDSVKEKIICVSRELLKKYCGDE